MGAMISPSDGMTTKNRLPKPRRVSSSQQKAEVPIEDIKGLIIDPGEPGPVVFRCFGKASRDAVIFRNNGLYGPMLGRFHRQVQGIRTGQFREPFAWVDELRSDDESRKITIEAAH